MKQLLLKIAEFEVAMVVCMKTGRVFGTYALLTQCCNRAWSCNDSSASTAYIYWGSLWGQTCCSVIDGKLQFKHAPAAKKYDINKIQKM